MLSNHNSEIKRIIDKLQQSKKLKEEALYDEAIQDLKALAPGESDTNNQNSKEALLYTLTSEALIILKGDKIIDCTPNLRDMIQMECNEFMNNSFLGLIHPENRDRTKTLLKNKDTKLTKCRMLRKDKSTVHIEMSIHFAIVEGKTVILLRDITDHVLLEDQLRESENKFRNLANTTSVAIMIYQGEKWAYANPAAERISGYTLNELKEIEYWKFVAPEYQDMVRNRGKQRQQGEDVPSGYEFQIIAKDGKRKWVYLEGKLTIYNGQPAGLISIIEITHIKNVELNLKEKNEALQVADKQLQDKNKILNELNQQLKKQNIKLQKAKEKAEESDRLKSAFLANMSHEIRTPMNAIMGFAEILSETEVSTESQMEFGKTIYSRSQHLLQIINDIVDISKIEANLLNIQKSHFDINQMLDELHETFIPILRKRNKSHIDLKLIKSIAGKFPIYTDHNRLEQILTNLISNAIKFTNQGSISIGYEKPINDILEFYVSDTGSGIKPSEINKIFDRFVMATNAVNDKNEGTGLGLAISKSLAELLGGRIWIAQTSEKGTSFHFTISICEKEKDRQSSDKPEETRLQAMKHTKILLVEDDEGSIKFMRTILEDKGADLTICQKGQDAIEKIAQGAHFDIILMDIRLPDMSGLEVTKTIKPLVNIPIIAQTAYALNEDRDKALQAGCDDYIPKPIDIEKLIQLIKKHTS
ncbi:Aerobic respiration control sensor protein ArcB [Salinivirga cyanobacteriivorans]|uniref:histidine kinase n=1 Tax=Salinivirga cyanobacteriivorans TaxID=1307839 RepID=A0A0S2HX46_9BACT|nr:ATP-binding protein [Salinivirga cyanobacteriivorans]ALO14548.1 Aerobic respiration control sensor protein ArcB [Salinivirga cyanobacteriivorans]